MTEDKDILLDVVESDTDNTDKEDDNINESEISGKITKFIRFMMDDSFIDVSVEKYVKMALFLIEVYESGYEYPYYNVSAEIYAHCDMDEKQLNNLSSNIESLKKIMHEYEGMYEKAIKGIDDLYDHIMLEIVRITDHKKNLYRIN